MPKKRNNAPKMTMKKFINEACNEAQEEVKEGESEVEKDVLI